MRAHIAYRRNEIALGMGDMLFLYTDSVTEACNRQLALFGEQELKRCLDLQNIPTPEEVVHMVTEQLDTFVDGAAQFDDITMLALRIDTIPQVYETVVSAEQTAAVSAGLVSLW